MAHLQGTAGFAISGILLIGAVFVLALTGHCDAGFALHAGVH